jgi:hypothetical protein
MAVSPLFAGRRKSKGLATILLCAIRSGNRRIERTAPGSEKCQQSLKWLAKPCPGHGCAHRRAAAMLQGAQAAEIEIVRVCSMLNWPRTCANHPVARYDWVSIHPAARVDPAARLEADLGS